MLGGLCGDVKVKREGGAAVWLLLHRMSSWAQPFFRRSEGSPA